MTPITLSGASKRKRRLHLASFALGAVAMLLVLALWDAVSPAQF